MELELFIKRAAEKHGDKYIYDRVVSGGTKERVQIFCKSHKEYFWQARGNHIYGQGCPKCGRERKAVTTELFVERAKKQHGNKYDYRESIYTHSNNKVKIFCNSCNKHFYQVARTHLSNKGCPFCADKHRHDSLRRTKEVFIEKSREVHGNKYGYDKVVYKNSRVLVDIYCPDHDGYFKQSPDSHTRGTGCNVCASTRKSTTDEFIEKAIAIHGGRYGYSKVVYVGSMDSVYIYCKEHKKYFTQSPNTHLRGSGCPICNNSGGEAAIIVFFKNNGISYIYQHPLVNRLRSDFFLPDRNLIIEYQGKQHYRPIDFFGGIKTLLAQAKRDIIKKHYCLNNGINFLEIPYWEKDNIETILSNAL